MPTEDERFEELGGGIRAIVSKDYSFGADAVLLARFCDVKKNERLCDLGTGCGIIPLLWARDGAEDAEAFEIQPEAAELARRAFELNGLSFRVHAQDFRTADSAVCGRYDLIACNPPYRPVGTGGVSRSRAAAIARHEICCTLGDTVDAAQRLLRPGGRFCVCHRPERLPELLSKMAAAGLEPKRMRLVQVRAGVRPWLVLVEGRCGAKPGLAVESVLIAEENGEMSAEMREIYAYDPGRIGCK